jgi:hypothetical protein
MMSRAAKLMFRKCPHHWGHKRGQFKTIAKIAKIVPFLFPRVPEETFCRVTLVVIHHKLKVLPTSYQEGQVVYFGKRGLSQLGAMLVRKLKEKARFLALSTCSMTVSWKGTIARKMFKYLVYLACFCLSSKTRIRRLRTYQYHIMYTT